MAYSKSDRYSLALNRQDNTVRIPAVEQESQELGYGDELEVTIYPGNDIINSVSFDAFINADSQITIPVSIRDRLSIDGKTTASIEVSFEATGERWTPEKGASARKAVYESANPAEKAFKAVTDVISADD